MTKWLLLFLFPCNSVLVCCSLLLFCKEVTAKDESVNITRAVISRSTEKTRAFNFPKLHLFYLEYCIKYIHSTVICTYLFQGRIAKLAFANPTEYSEMCHMPYDLVNDYSHLLMAFTCADDIDPLSYQIKAQDWLRRFHSNDLLNWNWPRLESSINKVHEWTSLLPSGWFISFVLCSKKEDCLGALFIDDSFPSVTVHCLLEHGAQVRV